jgi:hypothetical protein
MSDDCTRSRPARVGYFSHWLFLNQIIHSLQNQLKARGHIIRRSPGTERLRSAHARVLSAC